MMLEHQLKLSVVLDELVIHDTLHLLRCVLKLAVFHFPDCLPRHDRQERRSQSFGAQHTLPYLHERVRPLGSCKEARRRQHADFRILRIKRYLSLQNIKIRIIRDSDLPQTRHQLETHLRLLPQSVSVLREIPPAPFPDAHHKVKLICIDILVGCRQDVALLQEIVSRIPFETKRRVPLDKLDAAEERHRLDGSAAHHLRVVADDDDSAVRHHGVPDRVQVLAERAAVVVTHPQKVGVIGLDNEALVREIDREFLAVEHFARAQARVNHHLPVVRVCDLAGTAALARELEDGVK